MVGAVVGGLLVGGFAGWRVCWLEGLLVGGLLVGGLLVGDLEG